MILIKYVEIYREGSIIGIIGQDSIGKTYVKANDEDSKDRLNDLIIPYMLEGAIVDEDVSVSSFEMKLPSDPEWIEFLEYNLPFNMNIYEIKEISKKGFKELKIH